MSKLLLFSQSFLDNSEELRKKLTNQNKNVVSDNEAVINKISKERCVNSSQR